MIKVKIAETEVNLDPVTVDFVGRGEAKGTSLVRIGTVELSVDEAPEVLGKRIRAELKKAGIKGGRLKVETEKAPPAEEIPPGDEPPEREGEFLPPGGEDAGDMST